MFLFLIVVVVVGLVGFWYTKANRRRTYEKIKMNVFTYKFMVYVCSIKDQILNQFCGKQHICGVEYLYICVVYCYRSKEDEFSDNISLLWDCKCRLISPNHIENVCVLVCGLHSFIHKNAR